jgi:MFS family permease
MGLGYATMSVTGLSATVAPWFERHQGRSVALALTGASFGAMLVVPVLVFAIAGWGFGQATLIAALLLVALMMPLALTVLRVRRPSELGLGRDGDTLGPLEEASAAASAAGAVRRAAVRSWKLWSVAGGFALGLLVQVGFLTHHFALAVPMIGAEGAGMLVGVTGAAGLLGRLVLARVIDRVDPRRYSMGVFANQSVVLTAFAVEPSVLVLIPVSLVYGFCLGQITTLSPIVIRREFGAAAFGSIYGIAGTVIQFCSAFGPLFYGVLFGWFGGYALVLGVAAVFKLAAIAALASAMRRKSAVL